MLSIVVLLLLGVLLARLRSLPERAPEVLELVVIWLALPALILVEVPTLRIDAQTWVPVAVAWGTLLLCAGLVVLAGRLRGWSRKRVGTLLVVVPLGNTSFLGIPAVTALLGPEYLGPALVYDQLGSFIALATWATLLAARYGSGQELSLGHGLRRLITFPPLLALLVAVLLRLVPGGSKAHDVLVPVLEPVAAILVPLAMLAVGMRLSVPRGRGTLEPMLIGLGIRLGAAPAVAYAALVLIGTSSPAWTTSVLQAAMPPMVTASVLASAAGLDEELASALAGAGVLVALVSVPLWSLALS